MNEIKILEYARGSGRCSYCQQYFKDNSSTEIILKHTENCIIRCENIEPKY